MRLGYFSAIAAALVLLPILGACAKSSNQAYVDASTPVTTDDAGSEAGTINRGPATITLDGDANGLLWDDTAQTLYIADNANNRILQYTDAAGITKVADLPGDDPGLGQLARLADGTFVVTQFGFGTNGGIAIVKPDGTASLIPNLDVTKRRLGIAVGPDGTIYDSYFVKGGAGDLGSVATVTLAGVETDVVTGLQKPVGLSVIGSDLYMSDQDENELFVSPLSSVATFKVFATLPDADLICAGPDGSIFSGGSDGNVRQVSSSGNTTVFTGGFQAARGVAYDKTNGRIFVADHGTNDVIQIRPVQ